MFPHTSLIFIAQIKMIRTMFLGLGKHNILFRISKYSSQCNARSVNEMHDHTNNWNIKSPFAEKVHLKLSSPL